MGPEAIITPRNRPRRRANRSPASTSRTSLFRIDVLQTGGASMGIEQGPKPPTTCPVCKGTGKRDGRSCPECNGTGRRR